MERRRGLRRAQAVSGCGRRRRPARLHDGQRRFHHPSHRDRDGRTGRRIFGMTPEVSAGSAALAANQGLYNGFLAAGLLWALWADRRELKVFFLGCVIVAGVFGSLTAKTSILFTQALPAAFALALVLVAARRSRS